MARQRVVCVVLQVTCALAARARSLRSRLVAERLLWSSHTTLCNFMYTAKVVHGTRAYNVELIIPTELRHQLSKSNLKRQIGDIYEYTSLAYRASKTRKVPPLPPPRCRYATAFHLACAWHRACGFPPKTTWYCSA